MGPEQQSVPSVTAPPVFRNDGRALRAMAYFEDLSDYAYAPGFVRPGTKAVGWLARGHVFPMTSPDEEILDLMWLYCSISVVVTRGFHDCEFCPGSCGYRAERNGERLLLGTAEMRVFSRDGTIYAAPTLIYHYVAVHHYKPPDEFLQALRGNPRPPSQEYFDALANLNLEWSKTSRGTPKNKIFLYLNTGPDGRTYLEQMGTLSDIKRTGLKLEEGLIVHFYRSDTNGRNNEDYLSFEGTVHFDSEKAQWYAIIDQKSYRHESDLL
jgi:hypothetical protein